MSDRYLRVRDEIAANNRWAVLTTRFQDTHRREPTAEEAHELAVAAGVRSSAATVAATLVASMNSSERKAVQDLLTEQPKAEPPPPADGGARDTGPPPSDTEAIGIQRRIAEAERDGDEAAASAAKA